MFMTIHDREHARLKGYKQKYRLRKIAQKLVLGNLLN